MQAPPFWMGMFRIVGVLCLVTLLTPTFYILKYALFDHPKETLIADRSASNGALLAEPAFADGTELYIATAEGNGSSVQKKIAIRCLGSLAGSAGTQISRPVECLHAKLALEQVAENDTNPGVRSVAKSTLMQVASHDAVIQR
jgi:hypothetical protein